MNSAATLRARALRNNASPPERRLWRFLRTLRKEGWHFRRQAPIRGYFLDFVCYSHRLVIEGDGCQHGTDLQAGHDTIRDAVLAREGFSTLRVQATDVMKNLEGMTIMIRRAVAAPTPALPTMGSEK
jgi:very-short-patch-repair endonuclease